MNTDSQLPFAYEDFLALFVPPSEALGIALGDEALRRLFSHLALVVQWNRKTNLTRITDLPGMVKLHLLDSLIPGRWLPAEGTALDVGTGAGFPGLPLKVLHPALDMTLLDASRKKASFLTVAAASLGLTGIRAVHGRWEDLARGLSSTTRFDCICMRAVRLENEHIADLASTLLAPGGRFAWWGGPESEASGKPERMSGEGVAYEARHEYLLSDSDRPRYLHIWRKA